MVEREEIKGTPFVAIKMDGVWKLTMGQYVLSQGYELLSEVMDLVESKGWDIITTVILAIVDNAKKEQNEL